MSFGEPLRSREEANSGADCLVSSYRDIPSDPLVSILIVTWNRRLELARCIDSVLGQTYLNREIIVVDNAGSDGTADMISANYPEVRLICLHKNMGCPSGRNIGLANCRGKYVYQLDDDGWLKEDAVEVAIRCAERDSNIGVVMSCIHEIEDSDIVRVRPEHRGEPRYLTTFSGGCSMIRRALLDKVGFYPDDFWRQGEENDLALRLLDAGYYCILEPDSVMYHARSPLGRDEKTEIYYTLRNTNKTGLRLWPFPWCMLRPLINMKHAFRYMLTLGYISLPFQVLASLLKDTVTVIGQRKPVKRSTFRLFRHLSKHYWPFGSEVPK